MRTTKSKMIVLSCSLALICIITYSIRLINCIDIGVLRIIVQAGFNLLNGLIAWIAMKCTGMSLTFDFKNKQQYVIGTAVALALSVPIAMIPAALGFSLIGTHSDFSWFNLIYDFWFYFFIIGPAEELVFRVYVQDTITGFFQSRKWMGIIIASFLFGLWHIINGTFVQVLFTFGIGLVLGFSKYKIKNCTFVSLALAHGLYDFLNTITRMFII